MYGHACWLPHHNWESDVMMMSHIIAAHRVSELDRQKEEEQKILHSIKETRALMGVAELAKGVVYSEAIRTG